MVQISEMFETLRPYCDDEVRPAVERLMKHPMLRGMYRYLFGEEAVEQELARFADIRTVDGVQRQFSARVVSELIRQTSDGFTFSGLEHLSREKAYLFVANHRDIVLDSALLQWVFSREGHTTTQITFGSNLMSDQFVIDLGKLNKMFTFYRGGSRIQQYRNAALHSAYINHVILNQKESIWIAQRDGRTKDGNDLTQTGLLKMFAMHQGEVASGLEQLNIVPVTVSYELEPCAGAKVREMYSKECGLAYQKQPGEDFESVVNGLIGAKGRIHMAFGEPLNHFVKESAATVKDPNELVQRVAREIDRQVYRDYKLYPFHYVAYDLLHAGNRYKGYKYNEEQAGDFVRFRAFCLSGIEGDGLVLEQLFVRMYAAPVMNKIGEARSGAQPGKCAFPGLSV